MLLFSCHDAGLECEANLTQFVNGISFDPVEFRGVTIESRNYKSENGKKIRPLELVPKDGMKYKFPIKIQGHVYEVDTLGSRLSEAALSMNMQTIALFNHLNRLVEIYDSLNIRGVYSKLSVSDAVFFDIDESCSVLYYERIEDRNKEMEKFIRGKKIIAPRWYIK